MSFERRRTAKNRLEIDWDYPASIEIEASDDGQTRAQVQMYALTLNDAFKRLAGDDPRPLLVVRECGRCKGTDDALLSRSLDNERTLVLSRWFHCVKLMHHVLKEDHTFNQLFKGKRPPHLFLASADGTTMMPLPGDQSQSDLWKTMEVLLAKQYRGDIKRATKEVFKLLATYDTIDSMEDQVREQRDTELEKRGPKSPKLKRLDAKLAAISDRRKAAEAREKEITDLDLREPSPTKKKLAEKTLE